jgi:hypothetical protein
MFGRLTTTPQYVQASGESAVQPKMPQKFEATIQPQSPLTSALNVPPEWMPDIKRAPVVHRIPNRAGMRYLYARGAQRQPINRLGNSVRPRPNISAFQRNDMGPIRNAGFNDLLFQAGYPGFNLGLSFKVPTLPTMGGPRTNIVSPITVSGNRLVNRLGRPSGAAPKR